MKPYDYDIIVVGGGAAGFVSSKLANGLGKKAAMVERDRLGGDCTWYGSVPSRTLTNAGRIINMLNHLHDSGIEFNVAPDINTDGVMQHVRATVNMVYNTHLPEKFERMGIDIINGEASFIDSHTIKVGKKELSARKFIIATGSRAIIPKIEGIGSIPYLTNKTLFTIDRLPDSMIVLGGGTVGMELASAMNSLGVKVTVVERMDRILKREDRELAAMLTKKLENDGLRILTDVKVDNFAEKGKKIIMTFRNVAGTNAEMIADSLLITAGRRPNVEGLNLEGIGVEYTEEGVTTDRGLRTTRRNIYACGDVVGPHRFSHMAEYQAVIATTNAFIPFIRRKIDYRNAVWCTFTDPELAHAGYTEEEARKVYGNNIKVYRYNYSDIDRAKIEGKIIGMGKFITNRGGKLIGAHILGDHALEVIHQAQLARTFDISFHKFQSVIHGYPSYSDVLRQAAKTCYIDKLKSNPIVNIARALGKRSNNVKIKN